MTTEPSNTPVPGPADRQPNETAPAYQAFRTYLNQGTTRSTASVAQALGKSKTLMDRWCSRWSWVERSRAVDSADAGAEDEGRRAELAKRGARQAEIARLHGEATALISRELVKRVTADPTALDALSTKEIAHLSSTMARAHKQSVVTERLALGMTTDQPGEAIPREQAAEMAARLTDEELDARLQGVTTDELQALRDRKAGTG